LDQIAARIVRDLMKSIGVVAGFVSRQNLHISQLAYGLFSNDLRG
jgi:hypothetical protein